MTGATRQTIFDGLKIDAPGTAIRQRRNKYRAKKCRIDNIVFDSIREAKEYMALKHRQHTNQISGLELQPTYLIEIEGKKICKVKLDFRFMEKGVLRIVDVKGFDTAISRLKRKLVEAQYGIKVEIVR